jgi:hypothetical protein
MVADSTNIVNFKMISVQTFSLRFTRVKYQGQWNKTLIRWLDRPYVNGAWKGLRQVQMKPFLKGLSHDIFRVVFCAE